MRGLLNTYVTLSRRAQLLVAGGLGAQLHMVKMLLGTLAHTLSPVLRGHFSN